MTLADASLISFSLSTKELSPGSNSITFSIWKCDTQNSGFEFSLYFSLVVIIIIIITYITIIIIVTYVIIVIIISNISSSSSSYLHHHHQSKKRDTKQKMQRETEWLMIWPTSTHIHSPFTTHKTFSAAVSSAITSPHPNPKHYNVKKLYSLFLLWGENVSTSLLIQFLGLNR